MVERECEGLAFIWRGWEDGGGMLSARSWFFMERMEVGRV